MVKSSNALYYLWYTKDYRLCDAFYVAGIEPINSDYK